MAHSQIELQDVITLSGRIIHLYIISQAWTELFIFIFLRVMVFINSLILSVLPVAFYIIDLEQFWRKSLYYHSVMWLHAFRCLAAP